MARDIAIFHREYLRDYVVNERGRFVYESKGCTIFNNFSDAIDYVAKNYGKKPTHLTLDSFCKEEHADNLEGRLKKTKITI